jgi:hypothetical protein
VWPSSGVIFGFAGSTHTYALRLPEDVRQTALQAGAKRRRDYPASPEISIQASSLDGSESGEERLVGSLSKGEEAWCLAAYEFAR